MSCENRNKGLLPTTITPERIKGKKQVIEIGGDEREITPGKVNSRKSLFSQRRDNWRLDSTSTEITSVGTLPEQEADDILTSFYNVEDIAEKAETQIKVVILYPNGGVAVRKSFDKSTILFLYHTGHGVRGIKLLQFSRDLLSKISQSEICVCQRTQKWSEWGSCGRRSLSPLPNPLIFSRLPRSPSPSPITPATQATTL